MCYRALTCNMEILVWLFILIMCQGEEKKKKKKKEKKTPTFLLLMVLLSHFEPFMVWGVTVLVLIWSHPVYCLA